jgi:hypothetical protein
MVGVAPVAGRRVWADGRARAVLSRAQPPFIGIDLPIGLFLPHGGKGDTKRQAVDHNLGVFLT